MSNILPILRTLAPVLPKTSCRQLHRIVVAILAMTGRITQLGISRWTDTGGSYRILQRFFHTTLDWSKIQWHFFEHFVYRKDAIYLLAGDESIVSKSGKHTHGIGWFFSSMLNAAIPGLAFFSIALIDVAKRRASPLRQAGDPLRRRKRANPKTQTQAQSQRSQATPGTPKGQQKQEQSRPHPLA